jgi:hypothetical protein
MRYARPLTIARGAGQALSGRDGISPRRSMRTIFARPCAMWRVIRRRNVEKRIASRFGDLHPETGNDDGANVTGPAARTTEEATR